MDYANLPRVGDDHWALWAAECRDPGQIRLGYPMTSAIYSPPRRRDTDEDSQVLASRHVSEWDLLVARHVQMGLEAMRRVDHEGAMQLTHWWGAYPGAPTDRKQRVNRMGINPRTARDVVARRRAWVEGWVTCYGDVLRGI